MNAMNQKNKMCATLRCYEAKCCNFHLVQIKSTAAAQDKKARATDSYENQTRVLPVAVSKLLDKSETRAAVINQRCWSNRTSCNSAGATIM